MPLKSFRVTANLPGELADDIDKRWHELGYPSLSAYITGLVLYDLWSKREHKLTAALMKEPQYIRDKIIMEIQELYRSEDQAKKRPGGWLERELERMLEEERKKREGGEDSTES